MKTIEVLYEDNHILVVFKPSNLLSQSDSTKDPDLLTMAKLYLKEKYQKPGNVYLGLVHRLDRPVSGIMVFAKTSKAAARLSEQIRNHEMDKQYLAVIRGILPEKTGEFCDYLKKEKNGDTVVANEKTGKKSMLRYTVLEEVESYSLVMIHLLTGRHHQIRVQFASRGFSLYGDQRYGLQNRSQIALCSYHLSFYHPVKKEKMVFERYPNKIGIWEQFTKLPD